ncbi:MAG TPA: hypothetical protein VIN09_14660 [Chloroflexota bacterium]
MVGATGRQYNGAMRDGTGDGATSHGGPGSITLIGAGELMPAMSRVHRQVLASVQPPVRAVFLDTPAGFEPNAERIAAKAVEYYARRLQTVLRVASYRHARRTSLADAARAVAEVRQANFIFAGPGSPTYAVEHWRDSPVWSAVVERFLTGAHLLLASAASIAVGRFALPVYEIYKAGRDPYWVEGLDLFRLLGLSLVVVPHFDDNSGGDQYDSRYCYMGAERFQALLDQLPSDVVVLGVDEYTAVRLDPSTQTATVFGQGTATVVVGGERTVVPGGATVPFDRLRRSSEASPDVAGRHQDAPPSEGTLGEADPWEEVARHVAGLSTLDQRAKVDLLARIEGLRQTATAGRDDEPLVDLVLELRAALREQRRWDLADRARDVLVRLGYEIHDTPEGTRWTRR